MVEINVFRKNKINLEDYDYQRDIKNRMLMSHFSSEELEVLEEIIYSSTKISIDRLAVQIHIPLNDLLITLEKLSELDLYKIEGDWIFVDKEMRKYFETQLQPFDKDFAPGMEFLQALLRKVPIHVLPNWYPIPRASNNIFESLIEKYLQTPQVFQRYVTELNLGDPILNGILTDLFKSPDYKIYGSDVRKNYHLSEEEFAKQMLYLEFNFVGCLIYEQKEGKWVEVIRLFQEWRDYLYFLKESQPQPIGNKNGIKRTRPHDFSFAEDLSTILILAMKKPLYIRLNREEDWVFDTPSAHLISKQCKGFDLTTEEGHSHFEQYMSKAIYKLIFLKLALIKENQLIPSEEAEEWLSLPVEKRALNTYKVTLATYPFSTFSKEVCTERNIHEIEKSVSRIVDCGWVLFDDFLQGMVAPISENTKMSLKRIGRHWKYSLPHYSKEERALIHLIIYDWLFEGGMVATGTFEGKECLRLTPFGQSMFS